MFLRFANGARLAAAAAVAAPLMLGAAAGTATADEPPKGMPAVVDDVLQPGDPDFWNAAVAGTRVLTPLPEGTQVACSAGFEPPASCSTLDTRDLSAPQRVLSHVDVPVPGAAPVRVWFDTPKWGDGSTAQINDMIITDGVGS